MNSFKAILILLMGSFLFACSPADPKVSTESGQEEQEITADPEREGEEQDDEKPTFEGERKGSHDHQSEGDNQHHFRHHGHEQQGD